MSLIRRSLFHLGIVLIGMAHAPRFDWLSFFRSHGLDPDCEPRFPLTEFDVVDGRAGWQWLVSVKGYLDWRSGRDWQNWQQRRDLKDETDYYTRAINFLNTEVRHFGDAIPRVVGGSAAGSGGFVSRDQSTDVPVVAAHINKKKPASVKAARAAKAGAR